MQGRALLICAFVLMCVLGSRGPFNVRAHTTSLRLFSYSDAGSQLTRVTAAMVDMVNDNFAVAHVGNTTVAPSLSVTFLRTDFASVAVRDDYAKWVDASLAPDIVPLYNGANALGFINDGLYVDVTDLWDKHRLVEDTIPAANQACTADNGRKFGIPIVATSSLCLYRKSTMAAAMGPAFDASKQIVTFSDMLEVCREVVAGGHATGCIATDLAYISPSQLFDDLAIRMHGDNMYAQFTAGNTSFLDPRVRSTFDVLVRTLVMSGYLARARDMASGGTLRIDWAQALSSRDAVLYCGYESVGVTLLQTLGVEAADIGAFIFPAYDGPESTLDDSMTSSGTLSFQISFAIPAKSSFTNQSKLVLDYIADRNVQAHFLADAPGVFPLRESLSGLVFNISRVSRENFAMHQALQRSGLAGFEFGSILEAWRNLILDIIAAESFEDAAVVLDEQLGLLEATRLKEKEKKTVAPMLDPPPGLYTSAISVTLWTPSQGADIYYTLDGSDPTVQSNRYRGPILLSSSGDVLLRAWAQAPALRKSSTLAATFEMRMGRLTTPDSSTSLLLLIVVPLTLLMGLCGLITIALFLHFQKPSVVKLSSSADITIPTESLEFGSRIGAGSYGVVYRAKWRGTTVAVKRMRGIMTESILNDFVSEASILVQVRHPNIVIFMGVTVDPPSIVTEYMQRGSLYHVLHSTSILLDPSILFKWAHSVALGMDFLCNSGIIHGDLKSLNVLLDLNWTAKLCDFGLSSIRANTPDIPNATAPAIPRALDDSLVDATISSTYSGSASNAKQMPIVGPPSASKSGKSSAAAGSKTLGLATSASSALLSSPQTSHRGLRSGTIAGTLYWAAPEVLTNGKAALSSQSDAYSLGITLWEIATRDELYPAEHPLSVALQITRGRRPKVDHVPPGLSPLIPVCVSLWAQDPHTRMPIGAAVAALSVMYTPERVAYPTSPTDALKGSNVLVYSRVRGALDALLETPKVTAGLLRLFHTEMRSIARQLNGVVLSWGLDWIMIVASNAHAVGDIFSLVRSSDIPPLVITAARGGELGSNFHKSAPFPDTLVELNRVVFNDILPTLPYGSPSTMFVEAELVAELRTQLPTYVIQVVPNTVVAGMDALYQFGFPSDPLFADGEMLVNTPPPVSMATLLNPAARARALQPETILTAHEVRAVLASASSRSWIGTYSNTRICRWKGQDVLVKVLIDQDHDPHSLIHFAQATASAMLISNYEYFLAGPLAMCVEPPFLAIVVPFFESGSLADALIKGSATAAIAKLNTKALLNVLVSTASALVYLHNTVNIVHGALRPSNIMLTMSRGQITGGILVDWVCHVLQPTAKTTNLTLANTEYMSPGPLMGDPFTNADDVFSFGSVMYRVFSGSLPFIAASPLQLAARITAFDHCPLDASLLGSERIAALIAGCWDPVPESRPSMATIRDFFRNYISSNHAQSHTQTSGQGPSFQLSPLPLLAQLPALPSLPQLVFDSDMSSTKP